MHRDQGRKVHGQFDDDVDAFEHQGSTRRRPPPVSPSRRHDECAIDRLSR